MLVTFTIPFLWPYLGWNDLGAQASLIFGKFPLMWNQTYGLRMLSCLGYVVIYIPGLHMLSFSAMLGHISVVCHFPIGQLYACDIYPWSLHVILLVHACDIYSWSSACSCLVMYVIYIYICISIRLQFDDIIITNCPLCDTLQGSEPTLATHQPGRGTCDSLLHPG